MKQQIWIPFLILFWVAYSANFCYADGGFFSSYEADIWEPSQKGIIVYENGVETLTLQANFMGEAQDFAWVVPAPSLPELSEADVKIFEELHYLTAPRVVYRDSSGCGGWFGEGDEMDKEIDDGVTIISTETVGIYDTTTLSATNPRALADWLRENGYNIPPHGEDIVKSYVDSGWYFVAMKIQRKVDPKRYWYEEGGLQPISLKFSSDRIIYPMKITAVSATDTELLLYVFAQHKMTFKNAELEYSDWIDPSYSDTFSKLVKGKMYLTKLRAHLPQKGMDDIYLTRASNDKYYRKIIYVKGPGGGIDICLAVCVVALLVVRKRKLRRDFRFWILDLRFWISEWRRHMKGIVICVTFALCTIGIFSHADAAGVDTSKHIGIGFQANYPLIGGISIRYYGLSPVYLQLAGYFHADDYNRDNMLGAGISYAVFEHVGTAITRLYLTLEGGQRYEKDAWKRTAYSNTGPTRWDVSMKKTYGIGIAFGGEFVLPVFGTQIGWNAEIGQGLGRVEEPAKTKDASSIILSTGMHVYF